MARKYNLSSKSDMRRFSKDLEKTIMDKATSAIKKGKYDVSCPHCQITVKVPVGKSLCPKCRKQIDLTLNIN